MVATGGPGPFMRKCGGGGSRRGEGRVIYGEIHGDEEDNQRHGIWSKNLNTIKGQSLVFLWPLFWDWNPTTKLWALKVVRHITTYYPDFRHRLVSQCSWFHQSWRQFMVWYHFGFIKTWISSTFWYAFGLCWPNYFPRYQALILLW